MRMLVGMQMNKMDKCKNNFGKQDRAEPTESFSPEDLFDDCPVCQAEKSAIKRGKPLTKLELEDAFKRAKEKGGIVGGSFLKKDDQGF